MSRIPPIPSVFLVYEKLDEVCNGLGMRSASVIGDCYLRVMQTVGDPFSIVSIVAIKWSLE